MEVTVDAVKAFLIRTLGFAIALTWVVELAALMAAANEIALDVVVEERFDTVAVSDVDTGAPIEMPLITKSLADKVNGAEVTPARLEVEYCAELAEKLPIEKPALAMFPLGVLPKLIELP